VRRLDPERIYQAKRAGFVAPVAHRIGTDRAEAVIAATIVRDAASLELARGSAAFWREGIGGAAADMDELGLTP